MGARVFAFDGDDEIGARVDDVAKGVLGGRAGFADEKRYFITAPDRCLGVDVELAERFDVIAEEFDPNRVGDFPGEDVEDAAAPRELTAGDDLGDGFVANLGEFFLEFLEVELIADAVVDTGVA